MAEEMNANESGLNMGVLADIASLASEKNVSDETVRSLNEKVPGADKADQAEKNGGAVPQKSTVSRRSKAESGSKDSEELSPERAVAESLSDLRNLKAKHAPAPKNLPNQLRRMRSRALSIEFLKALMMPPIAPNPLRMRQQLSSRPPFCRIQSR